MFFTFKKAPIKWQKDLRNGIENALMNIENDTDVDMSYKTLKSEIKRLRERIQNSSEKMSYKQLKILSAMIFAIETTTTEIGKTSSLAKNELSSNSSVKVMNQDSPTITKISKSTQTLEDTQLANNRSAYEGWDEFIDVMRSENDEQLRYSSERADDMELKESNTRKSFEEKAWEFNQTPITTSHEHEKRRKEEKHSDPEVERERRNFETVLGMMKRDSREKEEQNRLAKSEKNKESDMLFQQELRKQEQKDEESFRKMQKEIDEYESETQRILEENMEQWRRCNDALVQCIRLKHRFGEAEREWSYWLDTIRKSIDGAKNRFKLFEKVIRNIEKSSSSYERIINNELDSLHKSTLSAYDTIYEAWSTVKNLAEQQSDRIFIRILQKQFVMVCNKTYNCLLSIDYSMTNIQSLDGIIQSFQQLNSYEIPTTGQLRNESVVTRSEQYNVNEEPRHYSQRTETRF